MKRTRILAAAAVLAATLLTAPAVNASTADVNGAACYSNTTEFDWGGYNTGLAPTFTPGTWCITEPTDYQFIGRHMVFQANGNLAVFYGPHNGGQGWEWQSGTTGRGYYLRFQNDGNVVLYDRYNRVLWAMGQMDVGYTYAFSLQWDGPLNDAGDSVPQPKPQATPRYSPNGIVQVGDYMELAEGRWLAGHRDFLYWQNGCGHRAPSSEGTC